VLTSLASYVSGSLHQVGGWLRAFIQENWIITAANKYTNGYRFML